MKLTCRFVFSMLLYFSITALFSQNLSDQETGFDAARLTVTLKKRGLTDQNIQKEVVLMRTLHNEQYAAMKKNEDDILQKITSEQFLKTETNQPANIGLTAKTANTTLVTDIPQTEKDALLALYNSTNGNNWTNKTGWNFSTPVTSGWYGITVVGGHVTGINLSNNKLSGTIPAAIGQLTELTILHLFTNQLSGAIPAQIGQLTKITSLYLHQNQLTGIIPAEIGQLTKTTSLLLYANQLTGQIPAQIGQLTQLQYLSITNNNLSGLIPAEIGQLTKLQSLLLNNNQLSGTIPASIGQLTKLQNLFLHFNQLSESIPAEIGLLTNLTKLYLFNNQLTGAIPNQIGQLAQLLELCLYNNQFSGTIPTQIGQLIQLTSLQLYSNQLTGTIPVEIGQLTQLQFLNLNINQLNGSIPNSIGLLTQLQTLHLGRNQLSGSIPNSIGQLTQLTSLNLDQNQLSGAIPATIGNLTKLTSLYFHTNQLSGSIPARIGLLTKLTVLYLGNNKLSGAIPAEIGQLTQLQGLGLYTNQLSGTIPVEITQLTQLTTLYLNNNLLNGSIPNSIGQLIKVTKLYLHGNQLSGAIPAEIGKLTQLVEVFLFGNKLKGSIPIQIGQLTKLTTLDLNANQLSGTIPNEIGQLTKLTALYLQQNQLSGTIPASIGQLTQLLNLNLYNNQLVGSIPNEIGQLIQLQNLNLILNKLSGTIPASIGQLTQLQSLYLNNNQFSGTIPASIGQLTQLKSLQFYTNQLEGKIPNLTNVITNLNFQFNKFRFVDFASEHTAYKSKLTLFEYSNQAKTDSETTITKTAGETQVLTMYEDNRFNPADTYQWYKNGVAIAGATSRQYTLSNLTLANAGDYYCICKNPQMTIAAVTNQNLILTRNTIHLNVSNCNATLSSASGTDTQTICASAALAPITYTTAGLITGATFSGLPNGVTGNFASNTVTISGTPAYAGTFPYTVTYTGNCGSAISSKGTITVPTKTVNAPSAAPVVCKNTAIAPITHRTLGGILTVGTPSGLPPGVTVIWGLNLSSTNSGTLTISGTPTNSGLFNYSIPLLGGCGDTINATGTITVSESGTVMLSSVAGTDNQSKIVNTAITPITYTTTGTAGATVTGLPAGVIGSFSANTVIISGTPAASGTFTYLITLAGECNTTINGKITSLCEPINGEIKIINEPTPTVGFPFQFSDSGTVRLSACNKTEFLNTFYAATPTLSVGTLLYVNQTLTVPLTNGNLWYKNQANATSYKVDSSGKIILISACDSGSGSGPGYAYQFSGPGRPNSSLACGQITYTQTYYAATNSSILGIGTQMYTGSDLETSVGSGNLWHKLADSGTAYRIDNDGKIAEAVNCTPSGCSANVTANQSSKTIASLQGTGITLSSTTSGTTFSWTVVQSGIIGATAGSGNFINQTLTNWGTSIGTATYTITPTFNNCSGTPIVVVITVKPANYTIENISICRYSGSCENSDTCGVKIPISCHNCPSGSNITLAITSEPNTNQFLSINNLAGSYYLDYWYNGTGYKSTIYYTLTLKDADGIILSENEEELTPSSGWKQDRTCN